MLTALFDSRSARQIAKFAVRVPSFPRRPIRKYMRRAFCSRRLPYPQIRAPSFLFQLAFDPQFASPICGSPHYPTLYRRAPLRFFLAFFCISPRLSSTFSRARPAFKFCRFARPIRSGYERACVQTPNFRALFTRRCARILSKFFVEFQACLHYIRAAVINSRFEGTNEVFARSGK